MATQQERRFHTTKPRVEWFETIELYHSQIGTLRYIGGQMVEHNLTLEPNAPRNGGQKVTFMPAAMEISPLNQSDEPVSSLDIQLGRTGQQVKQNLSKIRGSGYLEPIEVIYRVYRGDVTTSPMNEPQTLFVSSINLEADSAAMTAEDDNPGGVVVARKYIPADFPGMEVQI